MITDEELKYLEIKSVNIITEEGTFLPVISIEYLNGESEKLVVYSDNYENVFRDHIDMLKKQKAQNILNEKLNKIKKNESYKI